MSKETKRSRSKYPALDPELNLKTRWEEIQDVKEYSNKLSEKDKEWLNKFMSEYVCDQLNRKNLKKNFHNTKRLKKSCDDKNNARNRDVYARAKASGTHRYIEDLNNKEVEIDYEEELIEQIDDTEQTKK